TLPDGNGQLRLMGPRSGGGDGGGGAEEKSVRAGASGSPHPGSVAHSPADSSHGYARGGPFPDGADDADGPDGDTTHGAGLAQHARYAGQFPPPGQPRPGAPVASEPDRPRARGLSAWARRFAGARPGDGAASPFAGPAGESHGGGPGPEAGAAPGADAAAVVWGAESRPDPATILLTALGPGPRLWEREPDHPDALTVRIGTAHRSGGRPGGPLTVSLLEAGTLGLAGPRPRLTGLARSVVAQLAALHGPSTLEIVLLSTDRSREAGVRTAEWSWLGWLPHLRPVHGQDCRLLTAYDREQATARTAELIRRLDEEQQKAWAPDGGQSSAARPRTGHPGPYTLLVVDGDPGSADLRNTVSRLASEGPGAGIHLLCLAETPAATPSSPVFETVEAACEMSSAFRECGALALLSGAVATAVRVVRRETGGQGGAGDPLAAGGTAGSAGTVGTVDAVSAAWAERFARAMAPLREPEGTAARTGTAARASVTLPRTSRLLDELGLARATPAALLARWAEPEEPSVGRATLVFGAGPRGPLEAELTRARGHALVTGPSGSGKTELLRSLAASLSAGGRPDRLRLVLLDGDGAGEGLQTCLELPHARHHLSANDPVRMREFAQSLSGELKRRAELLGPVGTYEEFARNGARASTARTDTARAGTARTDDERADAGHEARGTATSAGSADRGRIEQQTGGTADAETGTAPGTLRLRIPHAQAESQTRSQAESRAADPAAGQSAAEPEARAVHSATTGSDADMIVQHLETPGAPMPRLVILVDDFDTLVDPALGNPGRPAAGSVVRALEAVARDGARLGMHVVAASGRPDRTARTAVVQAAALRADLSGVSVGGAGEEDAIQGRGTLIEADGRAIAFQAGRVTGRIPRTSTQRPTVVPLEWTRAGDPPTRRPVRELGNGPTDLALLASAVGRAARSLGVDPQESDASAANRSRSGQDEVLES
ncbi:MAG TPA: FtsK/SpoIIIE domain-containing protein, partial [Streptomyces sp.]|nr:FtsK/SpoIIIE domain-containing protein [Streptomyces sp.]